MDKQLVLDQTKQALEILVEDLTFANYEENRSKIERYLEFVQALRDLPELPTATVEKEIPKEIPTPIPTEKPVELTPPSAAVVEVVPQVTRYKFERKLRGGLLPELEGGYFLPEMMVREMGIAHGDLLEIESSKPFEGQVRYSFRIVGRGNGHEPNGRVELKYCVVEDVGGFLCVRKQVSGQDLRLNGLPFSFVLRQSDVHDLRLAPNDIIDVAYYENNPDTSLRVVWKHDSTKIEPVTVQAKPQKKEVVKETPKPEKEVRIEHPELFQGKHILVVGAKPKEAGYKAIAETFGASIEVFAGTESKSRTRAAIQRADVVVMVTAYLGHGKSSGSPQVVEMCKKAKVPFGFVDNMGNESFVRGVEEVFTRSLPRVEK